MSDANAQVKSLLMDTQLVVTNKFTVFSLDAEVDKTKLSALQKKADEQITRFHTPQIWLREVPLDSSKVFSCIVAIEKVNVPKIDDLTTQIDTLIGVLENALDAAENSTAVINPNAKVSPSRNLEALDALQSIRRKIISRASFFRRQGNGLGSNTDFQTLRKRQGPLLKNYTKQLENKSVAANEIDVMLLNGFAEALQASMTVPPFLKHYGELSDFIERRCPLPV